MFNMKKICLLLLVIFFYMIAFSIPGKKKKKQEIPKKSIVVNKIEDDPKVYKPCKTKYFDLLNTNLEIIPNFSNSTIDGIATLQLTPFSKSQDSLVLDAKGMRINSVEVINKGKKTSTKFFYTPYLLSIYFDQTIDIKDTILVVIDYLAEPYLWSEKGLKTPKERGAYFIDPLEKNPYKYTQLWTQGETEYNSCWFPTIEAMDEKFSQNIKITVDNKFKTLSNGLLIKSEVNSDGTRSDYWQQLLPHSAYLAFMAVAEYEKVIDKPWNGKEISYYTFPPYQAFAKDVFGNTSEMMAYFSDILHVPFPWDKYAQVVANDYTSGAMENTSAVILYEPLFADRKNIKDGDFDEIIAHELFHQWFGDLVTAESWANLSLNESFATYSEYLWFDYKYGRMEADYHGQVDLKNYFKEAKSKKEPIINFYYDNFDDIFDSHRYEKGGRVIQMLRDYLGDTVFFKGLTIYLNDNKYKSVEIHQLRLAMETASGEDLNWFFNQWWLSKGHPKVSIKRNYNEQTKNVSIQIQQLQDGENEPIFRLPIAIDIYYENSKTSQLVWMDKQNQTFNIACTERPKLVNIDATKHLLWEKEEALSVNEQIFKYYNCPLYLDKKEALVALENNQEGNIYVKNLFKDAILSSMNTDLCNTSIQNIQLDLKKDSDIVNHLRAMALDIHLEPKVRISALNKIFSIKNDVKMLDQIIESDSSYKVQAEAIKLYSKINLPKTLLLSNAFREVNSKPLWDVLMPLYATNFSADYNVFFQKMLWVYRGYNSGKMLTYYFDFYSKIDINTFENNLPVLRDVINYEENQGLIGEIKYGISSLKTNWKLLLLVKEDAVIKQKLKGLEAYFPEL